MLLIDPRWRGHHGIARFSTEVLDRLTLPHRRLGGPDDPLSPRDLLNTSRMALGRRDIVYSPGFNAGLSAARQVLTIHDLIHLTDPHEASRVKRAYYEHVVRPAVRRAGVVLTVSADSKAAIESWLGRRAAAVDIVDVGNGCADVFFEPSSAPPVATGDLLYVANLKPHKNPEVLLRALPLLPGITLTLVTKDRDRALELGAEHGVADRLTIVPDCTDEQLRDLYAAHRALVMPSLSEGFGLPAVEALATGLPVVHWAGCTPLTAIVGDRGRAVENAFDPEQWAQGIEWTLADPREHLPPSGWRQRYAWDAVAGRVERALSALP